MLAAMRAEGDAPSDQPSAAGVGIERPALSAAANETTLRRINEAIEEGRVTADGPIAFLCECGRLGCDTLLGLRLDEYEAVRRDSRRFLAAPGHEASPDEVVERHRRYVVTSKRGQAADVAVRTDPRAEGPVVELLWSRGTHVPALSIDVDAKPENVREVRRWVVGFAAEHGADSDELSRIALAVSEATTNAVAHAYAPAAPGPIHVTADLEDGELEIVVADDGAGLRADSHSAGLGLGLPLVAECSDRFAVRERVPDGTEIWMRFTLAARR